MRIVHCISAISDEASGPSYSVVRLCDALNGIAKSADLAALDWAPASNPPSCSRLFPLDLGPKRLGRSSAMAQWLNAEAGAARIDLLHSHGLWMFANIYPGRVARRHGVPLVTSPRGMLSEHALKTGSSIKRLFWPILQRPSLCATRMFHATSDEEYADIRRVGFRQPVAVVPNGIDVPVLSKRQVRPGRTLLFLGRLHPIKGLDVLLHSWGLVQNHFPDWSLDIVGPDIGGYQARLQRFVVDLRLERVNFRGPLYGADKLQAYAQADLYILPSYSENFGMSVAEALAAATPAIVSRRAPWSGLEVNRAGWWFELNEDALAACLEEALATSRESLVEMGIRGRRWMESEYSWERIGRQMLECYDWVLNGGSPPSCIRET